MAWMERQLHRTDILALENSDLQEWKGTVIGMNEKRGLRIGDLTARVPLIQGGMGVGISLSKLAGNVALNGGVGVISAAQIGFRDPGWEEHPIETNLKVMREEIEEAKKIAKDGIIAVNIMVATRFYEKYVRAAVKAGADLIISGAGLPVNLPQFVENSKTKIAPIVSSLKSCEVITKYWKKKYDRQPDLVVVEGPLAGGHLGFKEEELENIEGLHYDGEVKKIIDYVHGMDTEKDIPVVIAGGIYEAADAVPYMKMGADGVQVATRFVTTYECDADPRYKEAYIKAEEKDIVIIKSPVGMPGRAVRNNFLKQAKEKIALKGKCHQCLEKCNPEKIPYCITDALISAAKGNTDQGLVFCGANAYKAKKMEHVADIVKEFEEGLLCPQE